MLKTKPISFSDKSNAKIHDFFSWFNVLYLTVLVARNYINNIALWLTNFCVPILIFFIIHGVLSKQTPGLAIGVAASGVVSIGVLSLGVSLTEWKNSVIYKKIKVSLFSSFQFFLIFFIFYFFVSFLSFWVTLGVASLIDHRVAEWIIKISRWWEFFINLFLLIFISVLIGVLISITTKSMVVAQGLGFGIYIVSSFLTSNFIPLTISMSTNFLWYGGWWIPTYSPIQNIYAVFFDNLVLSDAYNVNLIEQVSGVSSSTSIFEFSKMEIQILNNNDGPLKVEPKQIGLITNHWLNLLFSFAWISTLSLSCYFILKIQK